MVDEGSMQTAPARGTATFPPVTRHELNVRIDQSETTLRQLGINPTIWRQVVPFVRYTRSGSGVYLAMPEFVEDALVQTLGERHAPLSEPPGPPNGEDVQEEIGRLMAEEGVDRETAAVAAPATLLQRELERHGSAPRLMREPRGWEAATSAAVAAAALQRPTPQVLSPTRQYFERLDDACRFDEEATALDSVRRTETDRRRRGGAAPKLRRGIYEATVAMLRSKPQLHARDLWERFPSERGPIDAAGYEIYRAEREDGVEILAQVNGPSPDSEMTYETFRRYVTKARAALRSK